jgi:hypothetical protein
MADGISTIITVQYQDNQLLEPPWPPEQTAAFFLGLNIVLPVIIPPFLAVWAVACPDACPGDPGDL